MQLSRKLSACALFVALAGCGHGGNAAPTPTPSLPPLMIDDRGKTMALEEAVTNINYKPWIPPRQILKYAVIPPLGGADSPSNRGIAIEYANGSTPMLLSEWPKQDFSLLMLHGVDITDAPCKVMGHFRADAVAWTTRRQLAMSLQPDGTMAPKDVEKEARRLISSGGC